MKRYSNYQKGVPSELEQAKALQEAETEAFVDEMVENFFKRSEKHCHELGMVYDPEKALESFKECIDELEEIVYEALGYPDNHPEYNEEDRDQDKQAA